MRILGACLPALAVLAALAADARAEPPTAIGLSNPLGWIFGSVGVSAYIRLGDHAMRGNVARYRHSEPLSVAAAAAAGGDLPGYSGAITDVGTAWVCYRGACGAALRSRSARSGAIAVSSWIARTARSRPGAPPTRGAGDRLELATHPARLRLDRGRRLDRSRGWPRDDHASRGRARRDGHPIAIGRLQVDAEAHLRLGLTLGR